MFRPDQLLFALLTFAVCYVVYVLLARGMRCTEPPRPVYASGSFEPTSYAPVPFASSPYVESYNQQRPIKPNGLMVPTPQFEEEETEPYPDAPSSEFYQVTEQAPVDAVVETDAETEDVGLQDLIDFSDVLVTPEQREDVRSAANDAEQSNPSTNDSMLPNVSWWNTGFVPV